jgi:hypothetical protein
MIATSSNSRPDPRLSLLLRASAKLYLVEAGAETLDDAFADLLHAAHMIAPCMCERATLCAWAERHRQIRQAQLDDWRRKR